MQPTQPLPDPVASPSSIGRFGCGLRGLISSPNSTINLQPDGCSSRQGSPQRSAVLEPVLLGTAQADAAISYFTYGSTKETMIRSPELHRHVLSTSVDAEAPMPGLPRPRQPLSSLLHPDVPGSPARGVRRGRRRGGDGGGGSRSGRSPSPSVRSVYESSQATMTSNSRGSSIVNARLERSCPSLRPASRGSALSAVYGQAPVPNGCAGAVITDGDDVSVRTSSSGAGSGDEGRGDDSQYGSESLRCYYSQYMPPLHLPPSLPSTRNGASVAVPQPLQEDCARTATSAAVHQRPPDLPVDRGSANGAEASMPAPADSESPGAIENGDALLQGHLEHLLNLHTQDQTRHQPQSLMPRQQQQRLQLQPMGPLSSPSEQHQLQLELQQLPDDRPPLPALDMRSIRPQRAASASSACSAASSITQNPVAAARLHTRLSEMSLTSRAAAWRRSLAADATFGDTAGHSAWRSSHLTRPIGAQLSGTLAEWIRSSHSVHSVVPDSQTRAQASGLWPECKHTRNGGRAGNGNGVAGVPTARSEGGGVSSRPAADEDLAAMWGRPRRGRGHVHVDPELVRQYTERPPKLCTPNNASRPVTSSDFVAFKNHTVNRAGTANTLRTVLGSNAPAGGSGSSGSSGATAAAEARGVTPLTTLLGPAWVPAVLRPRSPRVGVGGILTGSTSVPGLHVPLELDPPLRLPPSGGGGATTGASSPTAHSNLFRRSLEFSDGISSLGSPGAAAATAAAAAAGDRTGTPLTVSTFGAASSLPAPVQAVTVPRTGPPPHVRCGAGELTLDVNTWLTPPTAPSGELCGLFNSDDGESVALLSRVVKGVVQCDLGWAEVSESLMFMSTVTVPNAVLRFPVPHRAILQRFAATIGGTTLIAEAVARSSGGSGFELEEDEEDDDPGPGKVFNKGFGRRNHQPGPGGRAPMLRVPLGKVRGDIFITISYIVQLESSGNTLSLTHVCNWTPARMGWHLASREQLMSSDGSWVNNAPNNRRSKHKASDLYDLSFELEILSHRGLNLVSGPRHMTIKPNYDALLIQGYTQVWRPRHMTTVTFELALTVPLRSFAILHDAWRAGPDANPEPPGSSIRRSTNASYPDGSGGGSTGGDGTAGGASTPPPQASTSLRLIVPTDMAHLAPGAENGKSTITLRSAPPAGALNLEPRPLSTRHCAAVTFVPGSHFSPAELEDVLGPEVAPGPRAQAAAIRAGLPGGPGALPVELWVVVDCCGPAGIAAHVMQMLQTLQVLLRSLPVAEGCAGSSSSGAATTSMGGGSGGTTGIPIGAAAGSGSSVGGSTATGTGGAPASASVAAATLFNLVICPAAPLVLDPDDEEAVLATLPPELASLHLASRQQQHQQLLLMRQRQQQQGLLQPGVTAGENDDAPPTPLLVQQDPQQQQQQLQREAPLNQHTLLQQQQQHLMLHQDDVMALPPLWLFPGGSRPVNAETVSTALGWVEQLLTDVVALAAWAQPVSTLHDLLADVAWSPRSSTCRRTAVVLCQQVPQASSVTNGDSCIGHAAAGQGSSGSSGGVAKSATMRRTGGGGSSRLTSKHLNAVNQAGKGASGGGGCGSRAASARLRLKLESEPGSRANSRPASQANSRPASQANSRPSSRCLSRPTSRTASRPASPTRSHSPATSASRPSSPKGAVPRRGLNFGDLPAQGYAKAAAAAVAAAAPTSQVLGGHHEDSGRGFDGSITAAGWDSAPSANAEFVGTVGEATNVNQQPVTVHAYAGATEPYRPRSSLARGGGQGRQGGSGADGVRWSNGIVSNPRSRRGGGGSGGETDLSDSDPEAPLGRPRATGPSPLRGGGGAGGFATAAADGTGTGTSGDDDEELSTGNPAVEPPDVGFPVFVVVHELPHPPSNAMLAAGLGAAAAFGSNGTSYMLAYQLYQKHIEALLYRQARDEVGQLPLSYFERLAELHGGFVQVVSSALELSPALVLATSCAVNGRYLRQLRLVARGSVIREQFPAKLPPALPLSEPLTLLVSVDPRLRASGQLLPVLCALRSPTQMIPSGSGAAEAAVTAAVGWPPVRVTPQQRVLKRKATRKALAFNLVTPFTSMALVSMTLISNRGLTVQTLQTTQGRTGDQRHAFVWPAPVMGVLTATTKDAATQNNGAASPFHTSATFAAGAAAAVQGQLGQGPSGQVPVQPGQLDLPPELFAMMSGSVSMTSDALVNMVSSAAGGGGSGYSATAAVDPVMVPATATSVASAASVVPTNAGLAEPRVEVPIPLVAPTAESEFTATSVAHLPGSEQQEQQQYEAAAAGPCGPVTATTAGGSISAAMLELSARPAAMAGSTQATWRPSVLGLGPVAAISPDVTLVSSSRPMLPQSMPPSSSSSPFPSPKISAGPYTPPMSAGGIAEAHQLTVLGRLAAMQAADGSWPAVPELEELVVSNGRNLMVPVLGGPKPSTQAERVAAEVREGRRREALAVLRGQALHGAVSGPCWSTVLSLALLQAKYGQQRLAWIPLEAKAFSWLDHKWPPVSVCGMTAPAAIMRISALL
ncbi:hypothetical protein VOLCADRAFT_116367 [Volvox carteri f. nagariensis]|uniref:VIT domain-containing protein n=1 Tax=Volvox carteri f. nagariensis TaxID=3068 RepID=D8TLM7_VOLCA|nr:uncharacterized protein VOLCADRAFT_116367 [Volvox carteri f. nagariensis]EFJ51491.1 hypothetical protein VOLCADRAFT_116367 [Volvox carteri f. nagariensis]|eukprot:XP_002947443.1 hypothetical protein VOLCADRAFT_116367 [Volvox carteri f. nagariensis]